MAHLHRFFVAPGAPEAGELVLPPEEGHHALHVVRLKPGDTVALFDGRGRVFDARVSQMTRKEVWVAIEGVKHSAPPKRSLTLLCGWLLRDKAVEFLIQHGVEIGVDRFVFFRAERSERTPKLNDKWTRSAIEACKQCGRAWLPQFEDAEDLEEAMDQVEGDLLLATMDRPPIPLDRALDTGDAGVIIGPEGDLTENEVERALNRGAKPIGLGSAIFRAEMAALVAATLVRYHFGELGPMR
jgi:16S rRNA (uracil1498-N3)-methyltransferase